MKFYILFELIFTLPAYLIFICLIAAFSFAIAFYFKRDKNKNISISTLRFLIACRTVFIFLLSILLLEPMIKRINIEKEKPIILLAIDNSQSMVLNKDSGWVRSELSKVLNVITEKLEENFSIIPYHFSSELKAGLPRNYNGNETDFSSLFKEIENNYFNRNLGALIIFSDGIYNKGINPVFNNRDKKFPVYSVALGDTIEVKDLSIKKINHNTVSYLGNQFQAEVVLQGNKLNGQKGNLILSKDGKTLEQRPFNITSSLWTQSFNFILNADKTGICKYTVTASTQEGEKNKINNTTSFVIEVLDNREKVLILSAAPHPDISAIKSAIESNQNYEVETAIIGNFNGTLKTYGLVILHMIPWNNTSSIKADIENKAIPYLLISSSIADLFPGLKIVGPTGKFNEAEALINPNFNLFTISNELKNFIDAFPPIQSPIGSYQLSAEVNSFLTQKVGIVETENPLIYFSLNNVIKSGVILGDGIWRWKLKDFSEHQNFNLFNELVNKTVQFLSIKEDKSYFRLNTRKIYNENEEISFDAELYNKSYELITEPDINLTIADKSGKKFNYIFSKNQKTYKLSGIFFSPGEYSFEANVKVNGEIFYKKGTFTVTEIISEKLNLVANHQMLFNLSRQTGGKMYYKNQTEKLINDISLQDHFKTISYEQKKLTDLIDHKWIFFVILTIVSIEWFLRKRNGLY